MDNETLDLNLQDIDNRDFNNKNFEDILEIIEHDITMYDRNQNFWGLSSAKLTENIVTSLVDVRSLLQQMQKQDYIQRSTSKYSIRQREISAYYNGSSMHVSERTSPYQSKHTFTSGRTGLSSKQSLNRIEFKE